MKTEEDYIAEELKAEHEEEERKIKEHYMDQDELENMLLIDERIVL